MQELSDECSPVDGNSTENRSQREQKATQVEIEKVSSS